ncbi:DUF1249 domain-containing protein, partial [Dyella sp.]|uniref:DUF1249 domain-containing protein n=2 Tax=Dyella sp. TaxID=1869338 RepID=UPI003F809F6F
MSAVLDRRAALLPGRFEFLMGLYAENYHRLVRLFAPQTLSPGRYVSSVDDGLDVHLQLQECHPYTLELELTYDLVEGATPGRPPPGGVGVDTHPPQGPPRRLPPRRPQW